MQYIGMDIGRVGRAVDGTGLENQRWVIPNLGFKSLTLRQKQGFCRMGYVYG